MVHLASQFRLPKDALIYTRSIFDRSRYLIAYNIWSGLPPHRLDTWINNFQSPEEQYFAAKVLDALIYRPKSQTIALLQHLFQRTIPDLERSHKIFSPLMNIYPNMTHTSEPHVRIVPVLVPGEAPIKSGAIVGRHLRRSLRFHSDWFLDSSRVQENIRKGSVIVFIDDFLGTGNQFIEFVEDANLQISIDSGKCVYPPVALHRAATCIHRASRVIGRCCEYRVLPGVRNDAKGALAACGSSSPVVRKTHTCRSAPGEPCIHGVGEPFRKRFMQHSGIHTVGRSYAWYSSTDEKVYKPISRGCRNTRRNACAIR